jgi:cell division septation protein DedD
VGKSLTITIKQSTAKCPYPHPCPLPQGKRESFGAYSAVRLYIGGILTSTAANIVQDSRNWSLSWFPEGRSDSFTKEAILACAPPLSGVYGLFNGDCQVFIGESANIQEALLRHESETEFHSRHLRPTGFTFEPCGEELRKTKVTALIAKYRPVLQTKAAFTEPYLLTDDLVIDERDVIGEKLLNLTDDRQFPEHERHESPQSRRSYARLTVILLSTLTASALAIFYFGMAADNRIHVQASAANQKTENKERSSDTHVAASPLNRGALPAAKGTQGVEQAAVQDKAKPVAHSIEADQTGQKWSVQISSVPEKDIADTLMDRLKAAGYDGHVVPAEVNGKSYFRVRVGPFDGREEAESARQSLAERADYRNAYLTRE